MAPRSPARWQTSFNRCQSTARSCDPIDDTGVSPHVWSKEVRNAGRGGRGHVYLLTSLT